MRITWAWVAAAVVVGSGSGRAKAGDGVAAGWDKQAAAQYLDGRQDAWFAFGAADRGRGATKTSCVCCHMLVPYALARPTLRRLAGDTQPAAAEERLFAQTKRRVANWDALDTPAWRLLYDFNADKKKESLGTEAVLNALMLASDDRDRGRTTPGDETKKALDILWSVQAAGGENRGSWDWLDFDLEPWESDRGRYYGATLAAVAVGTAPGYLDAKTDAATRGRVDELRGYLRGHYADQPLYNRVWTLWASQALGGVLSEGEVDQAVAAVLAKQNDDGGWGLSSLGDYARQDGTPQAKDSDGYATGLILHVLQTAGRRADPSKLAKGLDWLRTHQKPTGAWPADSLNKKRDPDSFVGKFMADAATAFATLALGHRD